MIRLLLLFVFPFLGLLPAGCEKEPQVITETIVRTDTLVVVTTDTVVLHVTDTLVLTEFIDDTTTTFILTRHAETTGAGTDPSLSADGQLRAAELARMLKNVPLAAVFSTDFNRTRQTAQPTATDQGLTTGLYDPFAPAALASSVKNAYPGQTVLVVGHSNTVPALLNSLTGANAYANLPDTQYDNLFIVTVFQSGGARVLHLKYGKPS